jgi:predicted Zn-dependent peptidase
MRPRLPVLAALVASASLATASLAAGAPAAQGSVTATATTSAPAPRLRFDVKRATLGNGLRVVMLVDHTSPTVAVEVVYDVGARNEERGRTGFAHLFEHMMFEGSRNVARGEHVDLVTGHGGQLDAATSADRTSYFEVLPSSELALGLWLEADRMKSLDVSQSNLDDQRSVVGEEHRLRVAEAAYAPASLRLQELAFAGYWPYEHPSLGATRDLDAAQLAWVRAFHDAYYAPNNAVLALAGDLDEAEALALARRHFGDARAQPSVPRLPAGAVPEQRAPRSAVLEDVRAEHPAVLSGWVIPPSHEADHYALELAAMLLGDGETSRLHRALVRERGIAIEASASTRGHRGPDLFAVEVKVASSARLAETARVVEQQLADLGRVGPSDEEMRKLKNRARARLLLGLQSNLARASRLAELELFRGDASLLDGELDRYLAVTRDDIKRVTSTYLTVARRSVVEVRPGEK